MHRPMKAQAWWGFLAALLLSAVTARLGFWQLDRAAQKTALQQAQDEQRKRPVLSLAELATSPEQAVRQVHRAVELTGQWMPEHTVYLENRQMNGRVGFYAVTPLLLADGSAVLVQRGWFARDLLDRLRIVAPLPAQGEQRVSGRIALSPSRLFEFEGAAHGAIRQNLDVWAYGQEIKQPLRPLAIVQEEAPGGASDGLKRQWPQPSVGVEKHHGYAFQWFALSSLSAGLWLWFQILKPRRQRAAARSASSTGFVRPHDPT